MTLSQGSPFVLFGGGGVRITGYTGPPLAYLSVEHSIEQDVTSYPVESGAKINDHAVRRGNRLMLDGLVDSLQAGAVTGAAVWQTLDRMMSAGQLVSVVTHYGRYDNMLLRSGTAPEDRSSGARFRLELEQVLLVGVDANRAQIIGAPAPAVADQVAPRIIHRGLGDDLAGVPARRIISRIPDRAGD